MTWKKGIKLVLVVLALATVVLVILANRDLTRMYGGLTERADSGQFKPLSGPITIANVNVLSADGERFIPNQTVTLDNGLIVAVSDTESESETLTTNTIDGMGKYLIPGLTDAHVHFFKSPNDLLLYVANGVTGVRELVGEADHLTWRQQIKDDRLGPELFIASPRIGSFGWFEGAFMEWSQGFINLTTAEQAEQAVKAMHEQGYDAVKIYSQISREVYLAVTKTAHDLGMQVVGHVPWSLELSDLYGKQNSIAHLEEVMNALNREYGGFVPGADSGKRWDFKGYGYDDTEEFLAYVAKRSDDIASELRDNNIAVTTTLWLVESFITQKVDLEQTLKDVELEYENPGISEWSNTAPRGLGWLPGVNRYAWSEGFADEKKPASKKYWETYAQACRVILKSLIKNGVTVRAGTDANVPAAIPGFSLHDELISLNKAGMTPTQALNAATVEPIQAGAKANLVLLNQNPLTNISNTKAINAVILKGQLLDRALLDQLLAAVKQANDASRKRDISQFLN